MQLTDKINTKLKKRNNNTLRNLLNKNTLERSILRIISDSTKMSNDIWRIKYKSESNRFIKI
jgi:hypothetical protein